MKTHVDERLVAEARRFEFRFACEDCVHFDPDAERCSLGYPAAPRRRHLSRAVLELCKSFECT